MDPRPGGRTESLLALALDSLDDDTFHRVKATSVAAGVVAARLVGLTVSSAYCLRVRFEGTAGSITASADQPGITPQHLAVYYLASPQGASRALPPTAHPLAAAAVEETTGQGFFQEFINLLNAGYAVWRRQADADATALLDEPLVWCAVREVADALIKAGAPGLDQDQIETMVGEPARLTDHQVWTPDLTGLN